jgi:hypothetical protein
MARSVASRIVVFVSYPLALLATAAVARGAEPELQAIGETSLGYLQTTQSPADGSPGRDTSRGVVWVLAPGLELEVLSQRMQHRLGYRYQHDFLFGDSFTSSSTNTLEYLGFFDLSERVRLLLDAGVVESNQNSSITFAPPGTEFLGALPLGASAFLLGRAGETFTFDIAEGWRAWQGGSVVAQTPILGSEGPKTFSPGARLGLERVFLTDAVGVEGRVNYLVIEDGVGAEGEPVPQQRQLVTTGVGTWRHDWGRDFASRVEAGVLRLDRLNSNTGFWSPTGRASLAYVTPFGDASLAYSHGVTTNAVLGQTMLSDDVRLRAGVPLTKDGRVVLSATAGYQHGQVVDDDAELQTRVDTVLADAALGWRWTRLVMLGVRYQHVNQWSDVTLPGLPERFFQNAVFLGATIEFPPDSDMPRAYRSPQRVDGSDEIRDSDRAPRSETPVRTNVR